MKLMTTMLDRGPLAVVELHTMKLMTTMLDRGP
jgi:hypothetical protein